MGHWDRGYVVGMGVVGEWPARWCWGGAMVAEPRERALGEARGRGRRRGKSEEWQCDGC